MIKISFLTLIITGFTTAHSFAQTQTIADLLLTNHNYSFAPSWNLAYGYCSETGNMSQQSIFDPKPTTSTTDINISGTTMVALQNSQSISELFNLKASASYRNLSMNVNASAEYLTEATYDNNSISIAFDYLTLRKKIQLNPGLTSSTTVSEAAKQLTKRDFYKLYGDRIVNTQYNGGRVIVVLTISNVNQNQKQVFNAEANFKGRFGVQTVTASVNVNQLYENKRHSTDIQFSYYSWGNFDTGKLDQLKAMLNTGNTNLSEIANSINNAVSGFDVNNLLPLVYETTDIQTYISGLISDNFSCEDDLQRIWNEYQDYSALRKIADNIRTGKDVRSPDFESGSKMNSLIKAINSWTTYLDELRVKYNSCYNTLFESNAVECCSFNPSSTVARRTIIPPFPSYVVRDAYLRPGQNITTTCGDLCMNKILSIHTTVNPNEQLILRAFFSWNALKDSRSTEYGMNMVGIVNNLKENPIVFPDHVRKYLCKLDGHCSFLNEEAFYVTADQNGIVDVVVNANAYFSHGQDTPIVTLIFEPGCYLILERIKP